MKMRCMMLYAGFHEHSDNNPEESAQFWHSRSYTTFLTGTSGLTWAMGFSPFMARIRFLTLVVAWRTTLSYVREATCGVQTTLGSLSSGWSAGGGSWSSTSVP